jgi:hypothetical protein
MASERQIAANRRNALRSTGPRTQRGKLRSRRNALRHGLAAETIIDVLEDKKQYDHFAYEILAQYAPRTSVERELTLRLASLLWRLRRATAIESGLFGMQARTLRERKLPNAVPDSTQTGVRMIYRVLQSTNNPAQEHSSKEVLESEMPAESKASGCKISDADPSAAELGLCFLRLANLQHGILERLSRYEMTLWRQVSQTLRLLGITTTTDSLRSGWTPGVGTSKTPHT